MSALEQGWLWFSEQLDEPPVDADAMRPYIFGEEANDE